MKTQEFKKKNMERLRNLWDNFKCSNICIIGVPEEEEEVQEIENLFEKNSEEELAQSGKENKTSRSPGSSKKSQRSPRESQRSGIQGSTHQDIP